MICAFDSSDWCCNSPQKKHACFPAAKLGSSVGCLSRRILNPRRFLLCRSVQVHHHIHEVHTHVQRCNPMDCILFVHNCINNRIPWKPWARVGVFRRSTWCGQAQKAVYCALPSCPYCHAVWEHIFVLGVEESSSRSDHLFLGCDHAWCLGTPDVFFSTSFWGTAKPCLCSVLAWVWIHWFSCFQDRKGYNITTTLYWPI